MNKSIMINIKTRKHDPCQVCILSEYGVTSKILDWVEPSKKKDLSVSRTQHLLIRRSKEPSNIPPTETFEFSIVVRRLSDRFAIKFVDLKTGTCGQTIFSEGLPCALKNSNKKIVRILDPKKFGVIVYMPSSFD